MIWYLVTVPESQQTVKPSWQVLVIGGRVAAASAPIAQVGEAWTDRLVIYEKNQWKVEELPPL